MRTPAITGTWYPNNAFDILQLIQPPNKQDNLHPAVLMVPHAGYPFSGALAARAFAKLAVKTYQKIIILAPSHHMAMQHTFSVEPAEDVNTPFGPVKFSKKLHDRLSALPGSKFVAAAHPVEHAIDIQLPLIKYFLPDCEVGAMLVGQWNFSEEADLALFTKFAEAFRAVLDDKTLVILSTDFTHYGDNYGYVPFTDDVENNLNKLDRDLFQCFAKNDNRAWAEILDKTKATVCGASCMHLLLAALPENAEFQKLEYTSSGQILNSWTNSVGYTTGLIFSDWKEPLKTLKLPEKPVEPLSEEAGKILTKVAEYSLRCALFGKEKAGEFSVTKQIYAELQQQRGAFVTLTQHGQLRGCIGEIIADRPVMNVVYDRARSAAFEDHRFYPLVADEFGSIDIEVSVLSKPRPVESYKDIVLGRDGIILEKLGRTAVFLPQVATEQGWDLPTTLRHLSLKAGLPEDAWEKDASFQTFQAQIFKQVKDYYAI